MKRLLLFLVMAGMIAITLFSCNSSSDGNSTNNNETISEAEAKLAEQDTLFITIKGNDKMQFDTDRIVTFEGQTIILTLEHTGSMPVSSMGHNFVLIDLSVSVSEYANLAIKAKANDYIPDDPELTIAHTPMLGGGESAEITFRTPAKGTYDFLCSFPGHYSIMKGKFIVH